MDMQLLSNSAEPRKILETITESNTPAIVSYLSKNKWHVAKVVLCDLGACRLNVRVVPTEKPHPLNIRVDQPVGVSIKCGYGKLVFESKVIALEPSPQSASGGTIALAVPDRIEVVQRRSYFRVKVPDSLRVNTAIWHRSGSADTRSRAPSRYWQGRLVDISAGGAQVAVDTDQEPDFRKGQFIGLRFTPLPYQTPLMLNAQIRNILPTADNKSLCLGLQIVGLEASTEGRESLRRLCEVVEQYYKMEQSGVRSGLRP